MNNRLINNIKNVTGAVGNIFKLYKRLLYLI